MMILTKQGITLRSLTLDDAAPLYNMVEKHPQIWCYMTTEINCYEDMEEYIKKALVNEQHGSELPFAVMNHNGEVIGCTRLYSIDNHTKSCELGHTWYAPEVQRTAANTVCKYLLLSHAFETLSLNRVQLKAHAKNEKSIHAMQRIGAVYEGTLRYERPMPNGEIRDAVVYSFIRPEWEEKKQHLIKLLNRYSSI